MFKLAARLRPPAVPLPPTGPLSRGLVLAFDGIHRVNLAPGGGIISTSGGSPDVRASRQGLGVYGGGAYWASVSPKFKSSAYTLFAYCANVTGGATGNVIDNDWSTRQFQFRLTAGNAVEFIPFDAGGTPLVLTGSTVSADDLTGGFAMMATITSSGSASVWYNLSKTTGSLGAAPKTPTTAEFALWSRQGGQIFTGSILCALAWDRCLSDAECREVISHPWAVFAPTRTPFYFNASTSDVTVALSGLSMTASYGTLVPSSAVALSGLAATASYGTLVPALSVPLTGISVTASGGTLTPDLAAALSGLAVTASGGTLVPATSITVSGLSATASYGTLTASGGDAVSIWTEVSASSSSWTTAAAPNSSWTPISSSSTTWTAQ